MGCFPSGFRVLGALRCAIGGFLGLGIFGIFERFGWVLGLGVWGGAFRLCFGYWISGFDFLLLDFSGFGSGFALLWCRVLVGAAVDVYYFYLWFWFVVLLLFRLCLFCGFVGDLRIGLGVWLMVVLVFGAFGLFGC